MQMAQDAHLKCDDRVSGPAGSHEGAGSESEAGRGWESRAAGTDDGEMTKRQLYPTLPGAIGRLPTGEAYYAPIGRMSYDEDRVQCHLCGRWYKIVGAIHIRTAHGITLEEYREMFHLRGNVTTAAPQTSARKRATMREQIDSGRRVQPADMPEQTRVPPGPPTVPRFRSLAALRPDLVAQLHPTRNPGLDPAALGIHSSRRVWWRCPDCGTDWQREVKLRTGARAYGCPACGKRRTLAATIARNKTPVPFERSLAHKVPELLPGLHPTRNPGFDAAAVGAGSDRRVWWQCSSCGHEWQTAIGDRASTRSGRPRPSGCPRCARNRRRDQLANP